MQADFFQVAVFAETVFGGNPAGVVLLDAWPDDGLLQQMAAEIDLPATAFLVEGDAACRLRWFTPTVEEELCGHATMAAGFVLFRRGAGAGPDRRSLTFQTRSGELAVEQLSDSRLSMSLPARPVAPVDPPPGLAQALGCKPVEVLAARYYLAVLDSADAVRALAPDIDAIARLDRPWVVVTAAGDRGFDCVSRYFGPGNGVPEDAATGSAHCMLAPYWAKRLGRTKLHAFQASRRGGVIDCEVRGDRVILSGDCALFLEGKMHLDGKLRL